MLALLAEDLADIPTDLLEGAINRHVTMSPYMPKAADLVRLAKEIDAEARNRNVRTGPPSTMQEHCDHMNERLAQSGRHDIEWVPGEHSPYLRDRPDWSARRTRELETKAEQSRQAWKRAQARSE